MKDDARMARTGESGSEKTRPTGNLLIVPRPNSRLRRSTFFSCNRGSIGFAFGLVVGVVVCIASGALGVL